MVPGDIFNCKNWDKSRGGGVEVGGGASAGRAEPLV